ncbi:recombination directionality factor [Tellurirhabdus bombi]|uniref:recombination directionality factor n=1 Tax=Tellurirhabdus bombi TaxID=2907205 RepID=UPI001F2AD573|nr:hypothetical protein [Tellurirhabdus bombi]
MRIKHDAIAGRQSAPAQEAKRPLGEAGRIAIGEKYPLSNGKDGFRSTDYFVINSRFSSKVTDVYGEKPTELPILFHSDDYNEVCSEFLEIRDHQGKLYASGDGETFSVWNRDRYVQKTIHERADLMDAIEAYLKKDLPPHKANNIQWIHKLTIRFIIKKVAILGYWQFTTKGVKTSIPNLRDKFDECIKTFDRISYLPFALTVKKVKSNTPGDTRTYPVVDIVPMFGLEAGLQLAQYLRQHPEANLVQLALSDLSKPLTEGSAPLLLNTNNPE